MQLCPLMLLSGPLPPAAFCFSTVLAAPSLLLRGSSLPFRAGIFQCLCLAFCPPFLEPSIVDHIHSHGSNLNLGRVA